MYSVYTLNVYPDPCRWQRVFVYEALRYSGEAGESEEMLPKWFDEVALPLKVTVSTATKSADCISYRTAHHRTAGVV